MQTYVDLCDKTKPGEKSFYHPYGVMYNSAFDVLGATYNPGLGIYRQDAKPMLGSEEENIPDTLGVLRTMFTSSGNDDDEVKDNGPEHNFSWAQKMHWQEFKTKVSMLDEGTEARYRVLTSGSSGESASKKHYIPRPRQHSPPRQVIASRQPSSISVAKLLVQLS
ncbi:hypothetical protein ARMGADRAFT_163067 [Armillaria gallica]|uniref:Uncharacterized protein n=1 Tax=Armillaria gallica TaxID=47427 RepID=A0A2H3DEG6_ARMGA|nr:hypothetical protein ARMGADRAFT_163067 [Armillaria gallica]